MRGQAGFTLVEMAVVILVIGVLVGGVLSAMSFYGQSRRTASYVKIQNFARATDEFIAQYGALPGDMNNAQTRLIGCDNAPANSCRNGNGNAVIGRADQDFFFGAAPGAGEEDETTLFWYHLQAAGLISEINLDAPMVAGSDWGTSHPAAPWRGGYQARSMGGQFTGVGGQRIYGLFIRWQADPYVNAAASPILTPSQALALDEKFDDGGPLTGNIQARGANTAINANDGCRANAATYANESGEARCFMLFKIRENSGL